MDGLSHASQTLVHLIRITDPSFLLALDKPICDQMCCGVFEKIWIAEHLGSEEEGLWHSAFSDIACQNIHHTSFVLFIHSMVNLIHNTERDVTDSLRREKPLLVVCQYSFLSALEGTAGKALLRRRVLLRIVS